ncbi:uncharacterized protein LOC136065936, partial [Quercus suber]|uniref:uncharacterized protein LOC136065936 n=1 Tax=Quercus suber TaxID=58331 RepID=UPI0032DF1821
MESCGSKRFSLLSNIDSAKDAWRALRDEHDLEIFWNTLRDPGSVTSVGIEDVICFRYITLEKIIREDEWEDVDRFLTFNPSAVRVKITNLGRTALHVAIVAGRDAIVKELLKRTTQEVLTIEDNAGLTVLDCCAVFGNKQMAEIIVTKYPALLRIRNGPNRILPVVLAIWRNSSAKDMVSYLYEKTPKEDLKSDNGVNGATFINKCLYAKYFDLALDLLKYKPEFITCLDFDGESPPVVLATLYYALPSGNQLVFWKRWIYNGGPNLLRCICKCATYELPVQNAHQQGGRGES